MLELALLLIFHLFILRAVKVCFLDSMKHIQVFQDIRPNKKCNLAFSLDLYLPYQVVLHPNR